MTCSTPSCGTHLRQRRPTLEGPEHRAHHGRGELVDVAAMGAVPRVVLRPLAGEHMAVDALIGGQQPPLDGTRIGVRRQAERWRARLAAADAVGVADVAVGVEPLAPAGVVPPEGVEEAAHGDHPLVLAGRDLRPRPVDAVDLRAAGRQRREQLVGRAAVAGHEVVAVEVRLQFVVPGLGLAALERAAHDGAAASADRRDALGRNGAGGDVGVLDDRDRRPDVGDLGHDGRDLFAEGRGRDLQDCRVGRRAGCAAGA